MLLLVTFNGQNGKWYCDTMNIIFYQRFADDIHSKR